MVITKDGRGRPSRASILAAVDEAVAELLAIGGLPRPVEAEAIWSTIWLEEAHNSTAIEGNTLRLKEVRTLLEDGRAVGDKDLRDYLEVKAYGDAAQWVYAQALEPGSWSAGPGVTLTELREIHRLTVEPVWQLFPPDGLTAGEGPGGFREHDIAPFGGGHRPPPFPEVPVQMSDWITLVNQGAGADQHALAHLAEVHARFEAIHPFRDGNGRTGRLLLNLLLLRRGYPPAVVLKRDRMKYLAGLRRADSGDSGALTELIARAVKDGLDRFVLPGLAGPHRLLPLSALVRADVSALALRYAAERGRLRAQSVNGRWYSTKEWVDTYAKSRRRGPKPKS